MELALTCTDLPPAGRFTVLVRASRSALSGTASSGDGGDGGRVFEQTAIVVDLGAGTLSVDTSRSRAVWNTPAVTEPNAPKLDPNAMRHMFPVMGQVTCLPWPASFCSIARWRHCRVQGDTTAVHVHSCTRTAVEHRAWQRPSAHLCNLDLCARVRCCIDRSHRRQSRPPYSPRHSRWPAQARRSYCGCLSTSPCSRCTPTTGASASHLECTRATRRGRSALGC